MKAGKTMFNVTEYSRTGDTHIDSNTECQDVTFVSENSRFTVAVLADGVSSCENSRQGAQVACEAVAGLLLQLGELIYSYSKTKISFLMLEEVKCCLRKEAEKSNSSIESYSSTLSFCCIDKLDGKVMVFNLGDSAAIITTKKGEELTVESSRDELGAFTTTKDAYRKASVNFYDMADIDIHKIFLCSDGVLRNILIDSFVSEAFRRGLASDDYSGIDAIIESGFKHDDRSYLSMDLSSFDK